MPKRKRKPAENVETSGGLKRYTSDGLSVDSDDDMLLPDLTIASSPKERKFVKDDIAWAPYRGIYWPVIVTSVKWPSVCFVYINESSKSVHNKHANKLLPFDNSTKNQELKEKGVKVNKDLLKAYELVVQYLLKKKTMNISARRFLTIRDDNDKVKEAKDFLMRLGISQDEESSEDESYAHFSFCEEDENKVEEVKDGVDSEDENTDSPTKKRSALEEAQIQEIIKDLETLPSDMKVSPEQLKEMEKEAKEILSHVKSEKCLKYLTNIRNGSRKSSRHAQFLKVGMEQGGLGPFTLFDDLKSELLTILDDYFGNGEPTYKYSVMLPEAIIYGIVKLRKCKKEEAEKHFQTMCSKVGIHD